MKRAYSVNSSIFGGANKSLAHNVPASWTCSLFYEPITEYLAGTLSNPNSSPDSKGYDLYMALKRCFLVHDGDNGLKFSPRNLLPLPEKHEPYFDTCTEECLLILPILTEQDMREWNGDSRLSDEGSTKKSQREV